MLNANELSAKLIELDDRSRRNNLRIDGIKEEPYETWEACKKKKSKISLWISQEDKVTQKLIDVTEQGLVEQKQAKIVIANAPLFVDLTDLRINKAF